MALKYEENVQKINIDDFEIIDKINDRQLNNSFDSKDDFKKLYKSIEADGVLTPLVFARVNEKTLEIVSGRRRLHAINKINNKGEQKISQIPAIIIDRSVLKENIYLYSYNENNIKDSLYDFQKIRAILLMIYNHADYKKFIEVTDDEYLEDELYSISSSILEAKNKTSKKDKLNEKEQILQKILNEISLKIYTAKNKIVNMIANNILDPDEISLISVPNSPLSYEDVIIARQKNKKTKKILKQIKNVFNSMFMEGQDEYNIIKEIAEEHKFKVSDFYAIENIDNEFNEETMGQIDESDIEKYGGNLIKKLIEILKAENEKVENNQENIFRQKKIEAKTKLSAVLKKIDEDKLNELLTYLNGLASNIKKSETNG